MEITRINVFRKEDFRNWLEKNHDKEKIVELVIHKRHTGKPFPSHRELMDEAICFGWIDTIIKSVDGDKYIRTFQRRNPKSSWSVNTLSYAKKLIAEKRMTPHGLKFYHEGRKKKAFDHGIPKNPDIPQDLIIRLEKNKKAKGNFERLAPSLKRTYSRWILMAKLPSTRKIRVKKVVKRMSEKDWKILKF